jgi:hypothetical protein
MYILLIKTALLIKLGNAVNNINKKYSAEDKI